MILKILIGLFVVLGALAAYVATRPSDFAVSRSATFAAPAPAVFAQVNELKKWEAWSPWAKKDPDSKSTYAGPAAGKDSTMSWAGGKEVGEGRMTIVESRPNELVRFKLEFFKPFAATNEAVFAFKGEGDKTSLTWTMTGKNNFIAKAMCLVFDMDKMVGGEFEKGLAGIKAIVEAKK
jgi:hypothetical protein